MLLLYSIMYHTNPLTQAVREEYQHEGAFKVDDFAVMIDRHTSKICLQVLPDSSWKVTPRVSPAEVCKEHNRHYSHIIITESILSIQMHDWSHHVVHCSFFPIHSQIDMDTVLQYQPKKIIPKITLKIQWVGEGEPIEKDVAVDLQGVHRPKQFVLQCIPSKGKG